MPRGCGQSRAPSGSPRRGRRPGRTRARHRRIRAATSTSAVPGWRRSREQAASASWPNGPRSSNSRHPERSAVGERARSCAAPTDGSPSRWPALMTSPRSRRGSASTPAAIRWTAVTGRVAGLERRLVVVERAVALGLACSIVGEGRRHAAGTRDPARRRTRRARSSGAIVVNLASLWAGPLAADVLARIGARVINVESTARPDGARHTPRSSRRCTAGAHRSPSHCTRIGVATSCRRCSPRPTS